MPRIAARRPARPVARPQRTLAHADEMGGQVYYEFDAQAYSAFQGESRVGYLFDSVEAAIAALSQARVRQAN